MTVYLPWAVELILECIGAGLYLRRSRLLSAILTACAISDILLFFFFGTRFYVAASWSQIAVKEVMLLWLGCAICGMFVAERRRDVAWGSGLIMTLGAIGFIAVGAAQGHSLRDALLEGEITANLILLGAVAVGWISRRGKLNQAWKWIVAGFMVMVGSDLLFTALWMVWEGARHLYPLGAITAQVVWCIGPLKSVKLPECRVSLEKKFPKVEEMRVM